MDKSAKILHNCLNFTANSLARVISRMAEEEFRRNGLSPSHAFIMMLANDSPGITQNELAEQLNLAPSTITRFVDTLVNKGFLTRQSEGRMSRIYPTDSGQALRESIDASWQNLHERYSKILGRENGDQLAAAIDAASSKLSDSR
jgi:MarR family transcriptional regulator, organic hydroperoxide resistance regulator